MLNSVKVFLEDGTSYETSVSVQSTKESCEKYFVGQYFNMGDHTKDKMIKCTSIKFN